MIQIENIQGRVLAEVPTLAGANLTGVHLFRADLAGADLSRANLTRTYLAGANLVGANLTRANLAGADLTRANLAGANLTKARLDRTTRLPTGETWQKYLEEVVPQLLTSGGRSLNSFKKHWACHDWDNCPMTYAFGVKSFSDIPALLQPRAEQFIQLFDSELIPCPA